MKFGRRAFLQFTAGAVGGTLLSPLPWKLADDSSIWSQNWSWRPSPKRGEITQVPGTCLLCDGGCGIMARLVDKERVIFVDGNPNHPVNQGGVCPLCASGHLFLYAPYRIPQPMKQTRKRGDISGFQPISWDEAINELNGKLAKLKSDGKPHAAACITGERRSSMDELWQRFLTVYGSPNLFKMPSFGDGLRTATLIAAAQDAPMAFAVENASYILSFGANLIEGWGAPGRMQAAYRHWRQNDGEAQGSAKIVQVESRCSLTASKADRWIAVNPGSEPALALAIAHVLIKNELYDKAFIENEVFGFEDWTDAQGKTRQGFKNFVLSTYAPAQVAVMVGVEPAKIEELAREFARQNNAVVVWGSPAGGSGSFYHDLSFLALNALKGNLKPGSMVSFAAPVPFSALPEVQTGDTGQGNPRLDLVGSKAALPGNGLYGFLTALAGGKPAYPIELLMVYEANPAYSLPGNQLFYSALEKVGTLVSFSTYMDETAAQADLLLPNPMAFERYDDVIGLPGAPLGYYAVSAPIIKPQLDTKHSGEVILELGSKLGGEIAAALPWKTYEDYLKERVAGLAASGRGAVADKPGVDFGKLQTGAPMQANFKDGADLWKKLAGGFPWYDMPSAEAAALTTASGKWELAVQTLQTQGVVVEQDQTYLPHFVAPKASEADEKEYPLVLSTYRTMFLSSGYLPNTPFMNKVVWDFVLKGNDSFVEINPKTAQELGLGEGDLVVLKTPRDHARVRVHLTPAARPGMVYLPHGLGHHAYDQYVQNKGVNANQLIDVQIDPLTGMGTIGTTRAQLRRV